MAKICCCSMAGTPACVKCQSRPDCTVYEHYRSYSPFTWHHSSPEFTTHTPDYFTKKEEDDDAMVHPI